MPRGPSAPMSRNVHHSNLKTKQGKTFVEPAAYKSKSEIRTRSSNTVKHAVEIVNDDTVIVGQPPKKSKKNPKTETHFTIPNVKANQEMLMSHKLRAVSLMDDVVRELRTVSKIKVKVNKLLVSHHGCERNVHPSSPNNDFFYKIGWCGRR
jgi:hypothetical protein